MSLLPVFRHLFTLSSDSRVLWHWVILFLTSGGFAFLRGVFCLSVGATLTCGVLLQPILAHAEAWEHLCHMVVTVQGPLTLKRLVGSWCRFGAAFCGPVRPVQPVTASSHCGDHFGTGLLSFVHRLSYHSSSRLYYSLEAVFQEQPLDTILIFIFAYPSSTPEVVPFSK